jgi:hypothetical protein
MGFTFTDVISRDVLHEEIPNAMNKNDIKMSFEDE